LFTISSLYVRMSGNEEEERRGEERRGDEMR
jgi:hypothetical protein